MRRNIPRTRRILVKILSSKLFKQIAFEEGTTIQKIVWTKKNYIREQTVLVLNSKGQRIMNEGEGQIPLPLVRKPVHFLRVDKRGRPKS